MLIRFIAAVGVSALVWSTMPVHAQRTIAEGRPALVIGSVDGDAATTLFGVHSATRLSDGRIVAANTGTRELRVFAADGRPVCTMGREGKGPGEFTFLQHVGRMRGDTVVAYDIGLGRISRFTPDCRFAGSEQVMPFSYMPGGGQGSGGAVLPRAVGFLDDGRMLAHSDFGRVFGRGERRDTILFVLLARDGTPRDTLGAYPGEEEFHFAEPEFSMRRPVIFGRNTHAAVAGRYVVIGASDSYSIDIFLGERRLRTYSRPHQHAKVDAADVRAVRDEIITTSREQLRDRIRQRIDEFPARPTHPAFDDLHVGRDGSLWILRAGSPRAQTRTWDVFAQTASVPVAVTFPAGFTLLEAGSGYALGRYRDDLGVEFVHLYRLTGI